MYHVYVDPLFGDDGRATADNPPAVQPTPPAWRVLPLGLHPDVGEPADPHPISGVLQHAPFSFRTLTSAMNYARLFLPTANAGVRWSQAIYTTPGKTVWIRHVVIHCLPGVYGPFVAGLPNVDPASGLPFNGETWPVVVPSFVSIQGTSALDTIFDGRLQGTSVLGINDTTVNNLIHDHHSESFIDSVTVRNARIGPARGSGAGIFVYPTTAPYGASSYINVTNCFLVNNAVGIAFDSYAGGDSEYPQRGVIVNNTIAWNAIGLWAGNTNVPNQVSIHELLLLNNIFDSGSPPGFIAGLSGFEGVSGGEKQVNQRGGVNLPTPIDFNAWEAAAGGLPIRVNVAASILPNFPVTLPATSPLFTGPKRNITPYTRAPGGGRAGCLYIADIFRAALAVDYSPHDLRLAPMVTTNAALPPGNQNPIPLNPLVNEGIDPGSGSPSGFPIVMGNGRQLTAPPGLPVGAEGRVDIPPNQYPPTRVDGWDYDAEGFGNPRIGVRIGFPAVNPYGTIDIGADELGTLTIAGFLNGTRILTPDPVPNAPLAGPHPGIYFFDLSALNPVLRPQVNLYPAQQFPDPQSPPALNVDWWAHVQIPSWPELFGTSNYTQAWAPSVATERYSWWVLAGQIHEPFMRNLECDFAPHISPDPHPFWGSWMFGQPAVLPRDVYASNPWHDHPTNVPGVLTLRRDNPGLFHNFGGTGSSSWWPVFSGPVYVVDATLNPPGTYAQVSRWTLAPTGPFGPYTPCTGTSPTTYAVGVWGFGDVAAGCPDVVPGILNGTGLFESAIRFNCERFVSGASTSNLQTFLGIRTPYAPPEGAARTAGSRVGQPVSPSTKPTRAQLERTIRDALERR